jgi:hypothetical protein
MSSSSHSAIHVNQYQASTSPQPKQSNTQWPLSHKHQARSTRNQSYIAQSNHRNAAAQSGRGAVAKLHRQTRRQKHGTRPRRNTVTQPSNYKKHCKRITLPKLFDPQQDTAPPLETAHERYCKTTRHCLQCPPPHTPQYTSTNIKPPRHHNPNSQTHSGRSHTSTRHAALATNLT